MPLIFAFFLVSLTMMYSCGGNDDGLQNSDAQIESDTAETETAYREGAPAWLINMEKEETTAEKEKGKKPEVDTDGTLYENSKSSAYGNVQTLVVEGARNLDVVYDIYSRTSEKEKIVYIFLPCRADISKLIFSAKHTGGWSSGPYTADFSEGNDGSTDKNKKVMISGTEYAVVVKQSNIPSVHIKINERYGKFSSVNSSSDQSVYAYGTFLLEVTDELANEKGWDTIYKSSEGDPVTPETMSIRGRGNWTWNQNKKPYQIKVEKKLDLLGMGKAKKWVLLANVMDASLLRNQLFYDLANDIGLAYSPKIQPVDLFVNGEYKGSYSLATKPEVDESRVNIDENKDFLLEFDHYAYNETYTFTTRRGHPVTLHNQEDMESVYEIEDTINYIEELIYDRSSNDYADYIDIESWAKYYWVQDLSRNNDTLIGSSYIYYVAEEKKLYAGPIWDMDNTLGIWGSGRNLKKDGWHSKDFNWFSQLIRHSDFEAEVDRLYQYGGVRELFSALPGKVYDYEQYVTQSAEMNYLIHPREHYVPLKTQNYAEEVEYLQDFMGTRIDWYERQY